MKNLIAINLMLTFLFMQAVLAANDIVINEIMYNSIGTDVEYIELFNNSQTEYNLQNWYILDDNESHEHCVINWTLQPGAYLVIAGDVAQFQQKYPAVTNVNPNGFDTGGTGWALGNGGDVVRLFNSSGILHDGVPYDDGGDWPGSADGNGPSIELLNPNSDNSLPTSWDPSSVDDGTPGRVNSVYTENVQPICKDGERSIALPSATDEVVISVFALDSEGLSNVELFLNTGQGYSSQPMYDDGLNGDTDAGDSIYSTVIPAQNSGTLVKYYAKATDNIGQQDTWPNDAPAEYHAYTVDYEPPPLRISEILAVNNTVNTDGAGEYDDWFEIHNAGTEHVNLEGMFVSSALGSSRSFELPNINLAPDEYIIIWADDDTEQGALHTDFKLSSAGEAAALFETVDHGNVLIHGWKFGRMSADISMGFMPESGNAPEYLASPTPGAANESSALFSPVCINEFQSTSDFGGPDDWVEIYNRGTEAFNLSGCFLSDQRGNNTKWTFPQGTVLDPGEFLVIYEDALGFGFSADGDDVIMLTAPDSTTGLDFYDFGRQTADKSEGRFPDGTNSWQLFGDPTLGAANKSSTDVEENPGSIPDEFILHQNYPNPFNPKTVISYQLSVISDVELNVYNNLGQKTAALVSQQQAAGTYKVVWNADRFSSGVYFVKLTAGSNTAVQKIVLMK